jgi:superfamily II DNA or RNA helicase
MAAPDPTQRSLFDAVAASSDERLTAAEWPDQTRFPLNRYRCKVRDVIFGDLNASARPLIVAGYGSLSTIVDFLAQIPGEVAEVRLLIGSEPTPGGLDSARVPITPVAAEARSYWLKQGISILQSPELIAAIDAVRAGRVTARVLESRRARLHAKLFVGEGAVTLGSSNFTVPGLDMQWEANVRFEAKERRRYEDARQIAENYWAAGVDSTAELLSLLESLLRVVPWPEALARACLELLDGEWAREYLERQAMPNDQPLWPSQRSGIAQALWLLETTGSVLIADATGAGKTRMGAHLLRALTDRSWREGRVRRRNIVLVGPPAVEEAWDAEGHLAGVTVDFGSHGRLSRRTSHDHALQADKVRRAQVLAIDEAHNFLNPQSNRTRALLGNLADHTILFTATPINRGASDLLRIADMLGADNLAPSTLKALGRLLGARTITRTLTDDQISLLKQEIDRFTVRRTKRMLNALADLEPDAYLDDSGRRCRYPEHRTQTYPLGETRHDRKIATEIASVAEGLRGVAYLSKTIEMPEVLRQEGWTEERYLDARLKSASRLSAYQIMAALRSSAAALVEHVLGTAEALRRYGLDPSAKRASTGAVATALEQAAGKCPENGLLIPLPEWLSDPAAHAEVCRQDRERYDRIIELVSELSPTREDAKTDLLARLYRQHTSVLAFDSRPISLALFEARLRNRHPETNTLVASGERHSARREVQRGLAPGADAWHVVVLASDSMSEGINLQRASVVVHLDMPSVVRIAEQRVGRVDRMNSPHTLIDVYWPHDAPEFALRSGERFVERHETVDRLLGSNLPLPEELLHGRDGRPVDPEAFAREVETATSWDGIQDAFAPVRGLIEGEAALVDPEVVDSYRRVSDRVLSRVSILESPKRWAFVCLSGSTAHAPRWIFVEDGAGLTNRLDEIEVALRARLVPGLESLKLSRSAMDWLAEVGRTIEQKAATLLPRRKQVALHEMSLVLGTYYETAAARGETDLAEELRRLAELTAERTAPIDWDAVADTWLELVRPVWYAQLTHGKKARPMLLKDIREPLRKAAQLDFKRVVAAFREIPELPPFATRVTACILGINTGRR